MNKLITGILSLAVSVSAAAQGGYSPVLQQIEANNTSLIALQREMEVQKIGNRTGILPTNPEAEFNYLWGNRLKPGNRTDFSVKQVIDFPTAYSYRSKIANLQNANAEIAYKSGRIDLLLAAKQIYIELIHYNALAREYSLRLEAASRIASTYQAKMEKGDANAVEYNKARLNLATVQAEMISINSKRKELQMKLTSLNGNKEILVSETDYPINLLPDNFAEWYAVTESNSPTLQHLSRQIEIGRQQIKLNRALGLPKISAGYMSEKVVGEHFQGISLGVSIPLWENKNRVKQAKAQLKATEAILEDNKIQFLNHLQSLHSRALALKQNVADLKQSLEQNNNMFLLKKALDKGEISLLSYLLETEFYYQSVEKVLEAERDFELTKAELYAVEL